MSDDDLIRRGDARDILSEEGWLGDSLERINTLPAVTVMVKPYGDEAAAIRHSFDGYGWQYIDAGSGADWAERGMAMPYAEPLYSRPNLAAIREAAIRECADALRKIIDYAHFAGADPDEIEDAAINSYADYLLTLIPKSS